MAERKNPMVDHDTHQSDPLGARIEPASGPASKGLEARGCSATLLVLWAVLLAGPPSEGVEATASPASNPHGDAAQCDACHITAADGSLTLLFDGDISRLCQSCHDGQRAKQELHPVDIRPSETMRQRISADFPLTDEKVNCLTCHDLSAGCDSTSSRQASNPAFLRGGQATSVLSYCGHCHVGEDYLPFNVHDQIGPDAVKTDTCQWCHVGITDVNAPVARETQPALRADSSAICSNCHRVDATHPAGEPHLNANPTPGMLWYMVAYEMQAAMRLSIPELIRYARATHRDLRSIPLGAAGITCYTCHNPHEKGLLDERNPRSVGAEPAHAANHRLRARQGNICVACHEK